MNHEIKFKPNLVLFKESNISFSQSTLNTAQTYTAYKDMSMLDKI